MILADTSVWVEHFHRGEPRFQELLLADEIVLHPMVLGELACGNLPRRAATLRDLRALAILPTATHSEVLRTIELHRWYGKGISLIDAHLLASALLAKVPLWTLDLRLHNLARSVGAVL